MLTGHTTRKPFRRAAFAIAAVVGLACASSLSACCLTPELLLLGLGGISGDGFADVVAGSAVPVLQPGWASGPGMGGFRCAGRTGGLRAQVAKSAADPGRGQPLDR